MDSSLPTLKSRQLGFFASSYELHYNFSRAIYLTLLFEIDPFEIEVHSKPKIAGAGGIPGRRRQVRPQVRRQGGRRDRPAPGGRGAAPADSDESRPLDRERQGVIRLPDETVARSEVSVDEPHIYVASD